MIVTCERCETQFQLDAARVPDSGVRVRCSRCKHAFVVHPPSGTPEDELHRAARLALQDDETPDVTQDLDGGADDPNALEGEAAGDEATSAASDEGESDWQFNDERTASSDGGSDFATLGPDESLAIASEDEGAAGPASAALAGDALGSPEDWEIFHDVQTSPPAMAPPAARAAAPAPGTISVVIDDPPARARFGIDLHALDAAGAPWLRRAGVAAGWLATAGLCAIGLLRGLAPAASPAPAQVLEPVPGIELHALRGRWIDNAHLGELFVVSGELRNAGTRPASMPSLELVLRDAEGGELPPTRALGAPRRPELLREGDGERLLASGGVFGAALRPGQTRPFEVVAWPLPREAARFEVRQAVRLR